MSFRGGRGGRGGPGPGRGGRGAFPARGGVPVVVRGNVWTRDSAAATAPAARPPVLPQVAGVKRPREAEAADDDAGPATQRQKPALPELQDTLSRKLKEAEALRLRIELEAERVQQRKARLEAEQERARAAHAAAQEAEQRERSRKLQSGFAAAVQRVGAQRTAETPAAPAPSSGDAARRAADDAECLRVLGALTDADALGLRPHPQPDAVKSAYRALAKRLHPDKCTSARSSAAFQRIARAYQNLTK